MNKSKNIKHFLTEAADQGTLDSHGTFTMSSAQAVAKLAKFQLPRDTAWILKILQSAVRGGAKSIRITQTRTETLFQYSPVNFSIKELKASLVSPKHQSNPQVRHLVVGLSAAGFGGKRDFVLVHHGEHSSQKIEWNTDLGLSQSDEPSPPPIEHSIELRVAYPAEEKGRNALGVARSRARAAAEYQELVWGGQACPVPLWFDGRRLDSLEAPLPEKWAGSKVPLAVSWTAHTEQDDLKPLVLPPGLDTSEKSWKPTDKFTDSRVFFYDGELTGGSITYLARVHYDYRIEQYDTKYKSFAFKATKRWSHINWIIDGAICFREPVGRESAPVSFELFLSADKLSTDISGFSFVENRMIQQRRQLALRMVRKSFRRIIPVLEAYKPLPFARDLALYGSMSLGFLAMAPFTMGKTMPGALAVGSSLWGSIDNKRLLIKDCVSHLSEQAEETPK